MATGATAGRTAALWRFPVKSMLGERVDALELGASGFLGDRAFALVDSVTGEVLSAKRVPALFRYRAAFLERPRTRGERPPVRVTAPDGTTVTSDDPGCHGALSGWLGRDLRLESVRPGEPAGGFFDAFPVSVLTTSTLERLRWLRPESGFDERRFRMNVIVATDAPGFVENGWVGRSLHLGERAGLRVAMPDPRCRMTTLAQDDLPRDDGVLRTLARHNRLDVDGTPAPCAGVYAVVESPGTVRVGEAVRLG